MVLTFCWRHSTQALRLGCVVISNNLAKDYKATCTLLLERDEKLEDNNYNIARKLGRKWKGLGSSRFRFDQITPIFGLAPVQLGWDGGEGDRGRTERRGADFFFSSNSFARSSVLSMESSARAACTFFDDGEARWIRMNKPVLDQRSRVLRV